MTTKATVRYQKGDRVRVRHSGKVGRVLIDNRDESGCYALVWVALDEVEHRHALKGTSGFRVNDEPVHMPLGFRVDQLEPA